MPLIFSTFKLKLGGIVPTSNIFSKFLKVVEYSNYSNSVAIQPLAFWKNFGTNPSPNPKLDTAEGYSLGKAHPFFNYKEIASNLTTFTNPEFSGSFLFGGEHPFYSSVEYAKQINFRAATTLGDVEKILIPQVLLFYYLKFPGFDTNDFSLGSGDFKSQALFDEAHQFYTNYGDVPYQIEFNFSSSEFTNYAVAASFYWYQNYAANCLIQNNVEENTRNFGATLEPIAFYTVEARAKNFFKNDLVSTAYVYRHTEQPQFYSQAIFVPYEVTNSLVELGEFLSFRQEPSYYLYKNNAAKDHCLILEESNFLSHGLQTPFYYNNGYATECALTFPEFGIFGSHSSSTAFYYYKNYAQTENRMLDSRGGWQESNNLADSVVAEPVAPNWYQSYSLTLASVELSQSFEYGQAQFFYYFCNSANNKNFANTLEQSEFSGHSYSTNFHIHKNFGSNLEIFGFGVAEHSIPFYYTIVYFDLYPSRISAIDKNVETSDFLSYKKAEPLYFYKNFSCIDYQKNFSEVSDFSVGGTYSPISVLKSEATKDYFSVVELDTRFVSFNSTNYLSYLFGNESIGYKTIVNETANFTDSQPSAALSASNLIPGAHLSIKQKLFGTEFRLGSSFMPLADKSYVSVAINELLYSGIPGYAEFVEYGKAHPFFILEAFGNVDLHQVIGLVSYEVPYLWIHTPTMYSNDGYQPTNSFVTHTKEVEVLASIFGQFIGKNFYEKSVGKNLNHTIVELASGEEFNTNPIDFPKYKVYSSGTDWKYTGSRGIIPNSLELYPLVYLPDVLPALCINFRSKSFGVAEYSSLGSAVQFSRATNFSEQISLKYFGVAEYNKMANIDKFLYLKIGAKQLEFVSINSVSSNVVFAFISLKWATFSYSSLNLNFAKVVGNAIPKFNNYIVPFVSKTRVAKNLNRDKNHFPSSSATISVTNGINNANNLYSGDSVKNLTVYYN